MQAPLGMEGYMISWINFISPTPCFAGDAAPIPPPALGRSKGAGGCPKHEDPSVGGVRSIGSLLAKKPCLLAYVAI